MDINKLIKNAKVMAIICNQFGDTGKGKFSDYFASHWADITARGTGGNNAGHTVVIGNKEKIFHLLPTGITYDSEGKTTILGNGMVIDLEVLCGELDELEKEGMTYKNLMISKDAHVIMPYHISRDQAKNQSQERGGIGSTGRGIGPCYSDKIARRGIRIGDLDDKIRLASKIETAKDIYPEQEIDPEFMIESIQPYVERIKPFIRDTVNEMHEFISQGKRVLIEGAQGLLLSIEHGTYPFVTSSDCSLNGTANGVGLSAKAVDLPLGILKFPFMTRVGAGPFPTELGARDSESYCAQGLEHDIFYETKHYLKMSLDLDEIRKLQSEGNLEELIKKRGEVIEYIKQSRKNVIELCNSSDPFTQGVGVRLGAFEYGATTARPRRIGWIDAVAAKYAAKINGPLFILTKVDCLRGVDKFNVCYAYENGKESANFKREEKYLRGVNPKLKSYEGYGAVGNIKTYEKLPKTLQNAISDLEKFTGGQALIVSVGQEKNQTIIK